MVIHRGIIAAAILFAGTSLAIAEAVAPDDVVINDGEVEISLTGAQGNAESGANVFSNKKLGNCLACHVNEEMSKQLFHGDVGPPMDGVADRWEPKELRAILVNSKAVFGDETVMPGFYSLVVGENVRKDLIGKTILSAEQVEDVIAYLGTLKEE